MQFFNDEKLQQKSVSLPQGMSHHLSKMVEHLFHAVDYLFNMVDYLFEEVEGVV